MKPVIIFSTHARERSISRKITLDEIREFLSNQEIVNKIIRNSKIHDTFEVYNRPNRNGYKVVVNVEFNPFKFIVISIITMTWEEFRNVIYSSENHFKRNDRIYQDKFIDEQYNRYIKKRGES